jgi:hypothetical protein
MARRKLSVIERAIKDAAAELDLPKDHWDVERLATMQVMLKVARHKWSQGQAPKDAADMLVLMDAITGMRKSAGLQGPRAVDIRFVEGYRGIADVVCPHCHKVSRQEFSDRPFESRPDATPTPKTMGDALIEPAGLSSGDQAPASAPANVVTMVTYREGVSASSFHSQVVNGTVKGFAMTSQDEQERLDLFRNLREACCLFDLHNPLDVNGRGDILRRVRRVEDQLRELGADPDGSEFKEYCAAEDAAEIERKRIARERAYEKRGFVIHD